MPSRFESWRGGVAAGSRRSPPTVFHFTPDGVLVVSLKPGADEMAQSRWHEAMSPEADNIDVGLVTEADLCDELFERLENPF
jgi:hypothetical protein